MNHTIIIKIFRIKGIRKSIRIIFRKICRAIERQFNINRIFIMFLLLKDYPKQIQVEANSEILSIIKIRTTFYINAILIF